MSKIAPQFASRLRHFLIKQNKSQRQVAKTLNISVSAVNRIYNEGIGSEDYICSILQDILHLKRRRILEMLALRRSELSGGLAKDIWGSFKYAFLDEQDYLSEICPFPLERAFACTHNGVSISSLVELAKNNGISNINDLQSLGPWELHELIKSAEETFGKQVIRSILAKKCEKYPPALLFEFTEKRNIEEYRIKVQRCKGKLFFGLPHLVLTDYTFFKRGEVEPHRNTGGVEILYSIKGTYEITIKCQGKESKIKLMPCNSLLIYNARKKHGIKLLDDKEGRILVARFDPMKSNIESGRPRKSDKKKIYKTTSF